jgi:ATP-dependent Clp protease ATP-binding subunit ClpC
MMEKFTDRARKVMQLANQEAQHHNHEYIGTEHILLGLVKEGSGVAANVLRNLDLDLRKIRHEVEQMVQPGPNRVVPGKLPQTPKAKQVIACAIEEGRQLHHNYIGTEHLLLGLLRVEEGAAAQILVNLGLQLDTVRQEVLNLLGPAVGPPATPVASESSGTGSSEPRCGLVTMSKTPALDSFGVDLTARARQGRLEWFQARPADLNRVIRVLSRMSGNCPVLLGAEAVVKGAVVEGLAKRLGEKGAPGERRLVRLDLGMMTTSTETTLQLDLRMEVALKEARRAGNVILFLEDLHLWLWKETVLWQLALVGRGLTWMASATREGYAQVLERVPGLAGLLQPIALAPLSRDESLDLLRSIKGRYETHHHVYLKDEALETAIELAGGVGVPLFEYALSLIDEAGAEVNLHNASRPPDLTDLDREIEQLNVEKEEAVAEQDFDRAANLRDHADRLKKLKGELQRGWAERLRETAGVVDADAVRRVYRQMAENRANS